MATAKQGLGGGLEAALGGPAAHLEQENHSQGVLAGLGAVLGKPDVGHPSTGGRRLPQGGEPPGAGAGTGPAPPVGVAGSRKETFCVN